MGEQQPRVNRRTILVAAGGLAVAGVGIPASLAASSDPAPPPRRDGRRPVSMAMHVHASFSEGIASYGSHLDQARRNDVIWWTDHDFRVAAHDHRRMVHFDAWSPPTCPRVPLWRRSSARWTVPASPI